MPTAPLDIVPKLFFPSDLPPSAVSARRLALLFLEGLFYTACALFIADAIGIPQSGFFAVFLAAAGLTRRFDRFLDENRRAIYDESVRPWRANLTTATSVLALFLGCFAAFLIAALWIGEQRMSAAFGFVLDAAHLGTDTILTRRFAGALPLAIHNALVLIVFFALAFVYRAYGALLALAWNACIWGLVLAFLVRRGLAGSGAHPAVFVALSAVAVLPHLLLEAAAYVVAALAAIFLSKGVMKYTPSQPVFLGLLRSVAVLIVASLGCLLLGAFVKSTLPRLVLSLVTR